MKITNKINKLTIGETLKTGVYDGKIVFEKYQPTMKVTKDEVNLCIKYNNAYTHICQVQNGIINEQLFEAINRLELKAIERVKTDFNDFRRYNTGGK